MREAAIIWRRPLQVDLWPFHLESGVRVTCGVGYTSVPILVFLGLSILDLGPMYMTDRRQTSDAHNRLINAPLPYGRGIITSREVQMFSTHFSFSLQRLYFLAHCAMWFRLTNVGGPQNLWVLVPHPWGWRRGWLPDTLTSHMLGAYHADFNHSRSNCIGLTVRVTKILSVGILPVTVGWGRGFTL